MTRLLCALLCWTGQVLAMDAHAAKGQHCRKRYVGPDDFGR